MMALRSLHFARCGDLATLQLLYNQGRSSPYSWDTDVTYAAASNGHWPVLQWLRAMPKPCPWDERCSTIAAKRGDLVGLQWLRGQQPPCPWTGDVCAAFANAGNLGGLQWARSQDSPCPWSPAQVTRMAILCGDLDILQWLNLTGWGLNSDSFLVAAAVKASHVLLWLRQKKVPFPACRYMKAFSDALWLPGSVLMLLADIGWTLGHRAQADLLMAKRSFCTFHGLVHWHRHAAADSPRGLQHAFRSGGHSGQHLLARISSLPPELVDLIAIKAELHHGLPL